MKKFLFCAFLAVFFVLNGMDDGNLGVGDESKLEIEFDMDPWLEKRMLSLFKDVIKVRANRVVSIPENLIETWGKAREACGKERQCLLDEMSFATMGKHVKEFESQESKCGGIPSGEKYDWIRMNENICIRFYNELSRWEGYVGKFDDFVDFIDAFLVYSPQGRSSLKEVRQSLYTLLKGKEFLGLSDYGRSVNYTFYEALKNCSKSEKFGDCFVGELNEIRTYLQERLINSGKTEKAQHVDRMHAAFWGRAISYIDLGSEGDSSRMRDIINILSNSTAALEGSNYTVPEKLSIASDEAGRTAWKGISEAHKIASKKMHLKFDYKDISSIESVCKYHPKGKSNFISCIRKNVEERLRLSRKLAAHNKRLAKYCKNNSDSLQTGVSCGQRKNIADEWQEAAGLWRDILREIPQ